MRSKRMSAAQRAAKEKERRKSKTENLPSLEGDSLKNPGNSCSLTGTMAETNKVSGQRLVKSSLKKLDTETRTETRTKTRTETKTETRTKTRTETRTKLNNETRTETRTKLNNETRTETKTKLNNETKTETRTKLNNETKTETRTKLNNETKTETRTKLNNENEARTELNNDTETKLGNTTETRTKMNKDTQSKLTNETEARKKLSYEKETKLNNERETETKLKKKKETKLKNEAEPRTKLKKKKETKLINETETKIQENHEKETKLSNQTETRTKLNNEKVTDLSNKKETKLSSETLTKLYNEKETKLKIERKTKLSNKKEKDAKLKTKKETKLSQEKEMGTKTNLNYEKENKAILRTERKPTDKSKQKIGMQETKCATRPSKVTQYDEINSMRLESDFKMSNKRKKTQTGDKVRIGEITNATKKKRVSISTDIQNQIDRKLRQLSEPDYGKREVRLIDVLKQKPKTKIPGDTKKQKEEDKEVYVFDSEQNEFNFCPLSHATKERLQKRTNSIVVENQLKEQSTSNERLLTFPSRTKAIIGDGNCFFRALSFAIFGEEYHHFKIRSIVVNHLLKNDEIFFSFLKLNTARK